MESAHSKLGQEFPVLYVLPLRDAESHNHRKVALLVAMPGLAGDRLNVCSISVTI